MASAGEKSLAVGHIPGFQIDPKIFKKDFNCLKGMEFIWDLFCDFFPYKSQNRQRRQAMPSWLKLRQHRTIRQEVSARIFAPIQSSENGGILYVFPIFGTAEVGQKGGWDSKTQLRGAALRF